jgi:hypothetical protein
MLASSEPGPGIPGQAEIPRREQVLPPRYKRFFPLEPRAPPPGTPKRGEGAPEEWHLSFRFVLIYKLFSPKIAYLDGYFLF